MFPKLGEARDAIFRNAARNYATEMRQVRCDINGESVKRDPALYAHTERADFRFIGSIADPNPDTSIGAMRTKPKVFERVDHPAFESMDEAADILSASFEVQHHVTDPLAGAVIGVAASATGFVDWKMLRIEQFGRVSARPGCEQGRMLKKPNAFGRGAFPYGGNTLLHEGERLLVSDWRVADPPFDVAWGLLHDNQMAGPPQESKRCTDEPRPA